MSYISLLAAGFNSTKNMSKSSFVILRRTFHMFVTVWPLLFISCFNSSRLIECTFFNTILKLLPFFIL